LKKGKVVSASFSFEGWEFSKWLVGHWKTIKEVAKPLVPYYLSWMNGLPTEWSLLIAALSTGILSALEYFIKEYRE